MPSRALQNLMYRLSTSDLSQQEQMQILDYNMNIYTNLLLIGFAIVGLCCLISYRKEIINKFKLN